MLTQGIEFQQLGKTADWAAWCRAVRVWRHRGSRRPWPETWPSTKSEKQKCENVDILQKLNGNVLNFDEECWRRSCFNGREKK